MSEHHDIKPSKTHGGPEGMPIKVVGTVTEKGADVAADAVLKIFNGPSEAFKNIIIPGKSGGGGGGKAHH